MAKYSFRFQSVMRVKEIFEKRIQEEISRINAEISAREQKQKTILEEKRIVNKIMTEQNLKVSDYQSMKMYDTHLDNEIIALEREIVNLNRLRDEKQHQLIERKKEVKSFQILKDHDQEKFLLDERQNELKVLNEIAIRNHSRDYSE